MKNLFGRTICIELPQEDQEDDDGDGGDMVGHLKKSLYCTRDAAANFQKEVRLFEKSQGLTIGRYNRSTYFHKENASGLWCTGLISSPLATGKPSSGSNTDSVSDLKSKPRLWDMAVQIAERDMC